MRNDDGPLLYAVTADLPNRQVADEYVRWLTGHIQKVVKHGANCGAVFCEDPQPSGRILVESHYVFKSRLAFDIYEKNGASELRREGLEMFGPERGVELSRRVGHIVHEFPAASR